MPRPAESRKKPQFYAPASIAVILTLLYFTREVLIPLALAVFFAFLLATLVAKLERLRLARLRGDLGAARPVTDLAEALNQLDQLTPQIRTDVAGLPAQAAGRRHAMPVYRPHEGTRP